MLIKPPETEQEILQRAKSIAGQTLGRLAAQAGIALPKNLLQAKGLIGQLLEQVLGTTAGNKSVPDFEALGVELKTIPVTRSGKPCETTYVCTVPLFSHTVVSWRHSNVYRKLARVLWVPVEAEADSAIAERQIGMAFLWSPTLAQEAVLQQDWQEFMEKISLGRVETITAHQGKYLQIRPKAADASARTRAVGPYGEMIETLPRGFYLRTCFTESLLKQAYHI